MPVVYSLRYLALYCISYPVTYDYGFCSSTESNTEKRSTVENAITVKRIVRSEVDKTPQESDQLTGIADHREQEMDDDLQEINRKVNEIDREIERLEMEVCWAKSFYWQA